MWQVPVSNLRARFTVWFALVGAHCILCMRVIKLFWFATSLLCRKIPKTDPGCIVGEHRYTGIRLQHRWVARAFFDPPELILKECGYGELKSEIVIAGECHIFNESHCVEANKHCFRLVRKQEYVGNSNLRYSPGTIIGAVYFQETRDDELKPMSPLVADSRLSISTSKANDERFVEVGVLRSPDILEKEYPRKSTWQDVISPSEAYPQGSILVSNASSC